MKQQIIETSLGDIATYQKVVPGSIPVVFLHGVYYNHNLWDYCTERINDRTVVAIDMPHHGASKNIAVSNWRMEDCASMLLGVLESLGYEEAYAIGHSWGSMTILRAAVKEPHRFKAIGLCNMPLGKGTFGKQLKFGLLHCMLPFRKFYVKQVAKTMFSKASRKRSPEVVEYLRGSMSLLSNKEVRKIDQAVITKVDDGKAYLDYLEVPALALKGDEDYVHPPLGVEVSLVKGAHTSPLEQPEEVLAFVRKVLKR